jgi:hypothetical protein
VVFILPLFRLRPDRPAGLPLAEAVVARPAACSEKRCGGVPEHIRNVAVFLARADWICADALLALFAFTAASMRRRTYGWGHDPMIGLFGIPWRVISRRDDRRVSGRTSSTIASGPSP